MTDVYQFIFPWSDEVKATDHFIWRPIYDDHMELIGSFTLSNEGFVTGRLSSKNYPMALHVSTGELIYFTIAKDEKGATTCGVISERKLNQTSIAVRCTETSSDLTV